MIARYIVLNDVFSFPPPPKALLYVGKKIYAEQHFFLFFPLLSTFDHINEELEKYFQSPFDLDAHYPPGSNLF